MAEGPDEKSASGFGELFGSAEPTAGKDHLVLKQPRRDSPAQQARRKAAEAESGHDAGLSTTDIPLLGQGAWLDYARPGVQHGVLRKLRLGQYAIDARLDLHGKTVEQARTALLGFLRDCVANDIRCALIAHGTGRLQQGVLRSCLAHWLPQLELVLAFHSAQRHHGGLGATYLLLKKSERKRQQTFEEHSRRRKP